MGDTDKQMNMEQQLRQVQEMLDWAVSAASLGTWVWDIPAGRITYNDEYLKMLGYSQGDMTGTVEEWKQMHHPTDLTRCLKMLDDYLAGITDAYECEIRLRHQNGAYIWTRDIAKIIACDDTGHPIRLIGGHLNIDEIKHSEKRLNDALQTLEDNSLSLVNAVERHNQEMLEQGKLLWTINQISQKLLTIQADFRFEDLVQDCLRLLGESINRNRVYICKDSVNPQGILCFSRIYEWVNTKTDSTDTGSYVNVPYEELPIFQKEIDSDRCLVIWMKDYSRKERGMLTSGNTKAILIAPIATNGKRWGFISVDIDEEEQFFSSIEESMLLMSGSMLASAIEKMETEAALREIDERTQIMLNATPLCCNLWTPEYDNMSCNDEAVRLFELSSQKEYLERFYELSPEYQPCGRKSSDLSREYIEKAFEEGACRFEWLHQKLDGTMIPAEITLVRIRYKDNFIVAGYTRDLREQKAMLEEIKAKEALRVARDEALLNSKAKSNFLANMSHEIRTPMNAISGFTDIILRESPSDKICDYAKGIKGACQNLLSIINDILDITKIESGKLKIYNAPYELGPLLNDVISISRMRLDSKPIMFIADIDSHLPAQLIGDEIRIRQILLNIISNAIKYTHNGYISLHVSGIMEEKGVSLRFEIEDSGVGIMAKDLERLFEEFERVNTTRNRNIEGTGLGLAISKQLCEMMSGHIEVKSTYGMGSTFTICIPQECPAYQRLTQVKEPVRVLLYEPRDRYRRSIVRTLENLGCRCVACANQSQLYDNLNIMPYGYMMTAVLYLDKVKAVLERNNLTIPLAVFAGYGETVKDETVDILLFPANCLQLSDLLNGVYRKGCMQGGIAEDIYFKAPSARVLVVDDNPVNLKVAKGLMEPYEFIIDTAENGIEAVRMVKRNKYDLVFMDHMMPKMYGVDATLAIRKIGGTYYLKLPVIALTANALAGTREMFIREGMNDFLAKPIEMDKLNDILLKWLPTSKMVIKAAPATKPVNDQDQETVKLWSIEGIDTVRGLKSVGGNKDNYLQILEAFYADGRQKAVMLSDYIKDGDLSSFRTQIHALKGSSAAIGADDISSRAAELERAARDGDLPFISRNTYSFLACFEEVLEAISPIINNTHLQTLETKENGNTQRLREELETLYLSAEMADLGTLEKKMETIMKYTWKKEILQELKTAQQCLSIFDYDGITEAVLRLKGIL